MLGFIPIYIRASYCNIYLCPKILLLSLLRKS